MADIITRLLLKTDDFNAKLNNAKGSVNSFQGGVSNMAKTAGAGVMKFAGSIGIAIGAGEGLMRTIRGSQATSDMFDNNMNACKDSVDAFFSSLSTGDFTAFENGLFSVFTTARDLSAALDDIADKRLAVDLVDLRKQGEMTALEAIIRDSSKTKKERDDALTKYTNLAKEVATDRLDIAKEELSGNTKVELNKIGVKNLSQEDITLYLEKLNNKDLNKDFIDQLNAVSAYIAERNEKQLEVRRYDYKMIAPSALKEMQDDFKKNYPDPEEWLHTQFPNTEFRDTKQLLDFGKLFQQNDKGRAVLYEFTRKLYLAQNQNAADLRKITRLNNSVGVKEPDVPKPDKKENPLEGSFDEIDTKIAELKKELNKKVTTEARATIQADINELEQRKIKLKFVVDKEVFKIEHGELKPNKLQTPGTQDSPTPDSWEAQRVIIDFYNREIAQKQSELSQATSTSAKLFIQTEIDKLKRVLDEYKKVQEKSSRIPGGAYSAFRNNSSKGKDGKELDLHKQIKTMKLPKVKNPVDKKDIKTNKAYSESLQSVASSFGILGSAAEAFGSDGLAFAFNSIGSIADMIIQLQGLATAKGVASALELPFPENLAAIATVVGTVASIFSSIPKFANGGIVPGNSFSGDRVPAMVNSGEMILNGTQQSRLFGMLNGYSLQSTSIPFNSNKIAQYVTPNDHSASSAPKEVTFRIHGKELEGVLKNYYNQKSKVR